MPLPVYRGPAKKAGSGTPCSRCKSRTSSGKALLGSRRLSIAQEIGSLLANPKRRSAERDACATAAVECASLSQPVNRRATRSSSVLAEVMAAGYGRSRTTTRENRWLYALRSTRSPSRRTRARAKSTGLLPPSGRPRSAGTASLAAHEPPPKSARSRTMPGPRGPRTPLHFPMRRPPVDAQRRASGPCVRLSTGLPRTRGATVCAVLGLCPTEASGWSPSSVIPAAGGVVRPWHD